MNIYLIQLLGKWINVIFVSAISLFGINNTQHVANVHNESMNKDLSGINIVTDYPTIVKYNQNLNEGTINVLQEGVIGLTYEKDNGVKVEIQSVVPKIVEKGTKKNEVKKVEKKKIDPTFVGKLTGYGAGCKGCSKLANVSCKTKVGKKHSLINDGIYYNDEIYGKVRILAAATSKFPCGTIVQITKNQKKLLGVVLDTGSSMNNAWAKGKVWMDLAYSSNTIAGNDGFTGSNITFTIQRWGW